MFDRISSKKKKKSSRDKKSQQPTHISTNHTAPSAKRLSHNQPHSISQCIISKDSRQRAQLDSSQLASSTQLGSQLNNNNYSLLKKLPRCCSRLVSVSSPSQEQQRQQKQVQSGNDVDPGRAQSRPMMLFVMPTPLRDLLPGKAVDIQCCS